jgi:hypothetical protein
MRTIVTLSENEMACATEIAIIQEKNCKLKGYQDNHGYASTPSEIKIKNSKEGLMSEMAVAKYLGMPWPAKNRGFQDADIGENIQVKSTNVTNGRLIVRPNARMSDIYILVIRDSIPNFYLAGWILASDARRSEWLYNDNGRPPMWFVPQKALKPIELLK